MRIILHKTGVSCLYSMDENVCINAILLQFVFSFLTFNFRY